MMPGFFLDDRKKMETLFGRRALRASAFMMAVVVLMVGVAEFFCEREIIFPEVAALCAGCFLSPRLVWTTGYVRMVLCVSLCAVLGVLIVRFVPAPVPVQFATAVLLGQLVLFASRTTFAPLVSAIALPVLIQTRSFVYVAAAFFLTVLVVVLRAVAVRLGIAEAVKGGSVSVPVREFVPVLLFRMAVVCALSAFAIPAGLKFIVAPPLVVAFTELSGRGSRAMSRPFSAVALITLCALSGSLCRLAFCAGLGLPLSSAAFVSSAASIALVRLFGMVFPPAAALCVLALLIPAESVAFFPLQVFAGITVFVLASALWRKMTGGKSAS